MRNFYVGVLVVCVAVGAGSAWGAGPAAAKDAEIEQQIRTLEDEEVQAILAHDIGTLERLWDKAYIVHNPEGRIVPAGASITDRPVFQNPRAAFVREVESIVINGDVAFSMGERDRDPDAGGAEDRTSDPETLYQCVAAEGRRVETVGATRQQSVRCRLARSRAGVLPQRRTTNCTPVSAVGQYQPKQQPG